MNMDVYRLVIHSEGKPLSNPLYTLVYILFLCSPYLFFQSRVWARKVYFFLVHSMHYKVLDHRFHSHSTMFRFSKIKVRIMCIEIVCYMICQPGRLQLIDGISWCAVPTTVKLDSSCFVAKQRWTIMFQDEFIKIFLSIKLSMQTSSNAPSIAFEPPVLCYCVIVKDYSIHHIFNLNIQRESILCRGPNTLKTTYL